MKYSFPLRSKAAENQYGFGGDSLDDVANLFVVEQQINELRYFDIIDGDHRLTGRRDDEIRLLRPDEVDIPHGNPIDRTPRQVRLLKVCVHQRGSPKVRPPEVCFPEVCAPEVCAPEACPSEVCPPEVCPY